jgi:hypothetical protein
MGQNRWVILLVIECLSFVAPATLCLALAVLPVHSVLELIAAVCGVGAWIALLALVNWWEFTSIHLRWVWIAAFAAVAAGRGTAASGLPAVSSAGVVQTAALVAIFAAGAWTVACALRARRPGAAPVELSYPLAQGTYLITDGGDGARSFLVNYHYGFGRHRASGVNASMRYAIDMVAIGAGGVESSGFLPRNNDAYRIWRRSLKAPCDGRVVHVVNDIADNAAFGAHRPYGVGNHLVIQNGEDVFVVLGHLLKGSVTVAVGQQARSGEEIGKVGNSGWTERPHLHMQATRSASGDWWHGDPVPMNFGGRFLVRNQVFRS